MYFQLQHVFFINNIFVSRIMCAFSWVISIVILGINFFFVGQTLVCSVRSCTLMYDVKASAHTTILVGRCMVGVISVKLYFNHTLGTVLLYARHYMLSLSCLHGRSNQVTSSLQLGCMLKRKSVRGIICALLFLVSLDSFTIFGCVYQVRCSSDGCEEVDELRMFR